MRSPILLKSYIFSIFAISLVCSIYYFFQEPMDWTQLAPLLLLTYFAERFKIRIFMYQAKESVSVSWGSVLSIGALIALGAPEAILVSATLGVISSLFTKDLSLIKLLYNVSANVFSVIVTSFVIDQGVQYVYSYSNQPIIPILAFLLASIIYLLINYLLICTLMKIITAKTFLAILNDIVGPHVPHSVMLALIGGLLGSSYGQYKWIALLLTLLMIGLILHSLKSTAVAASKRIEELQESNRQTELFAQKMDLTLDEFIQTLTATIDARDPYMYGHSMQVSNYAVALANELKLDEEEIKRIRVAGLLHDIGKISIPETILFKPGRLTDEEYEVIKRHAQIGEEIIEQISTLSDVAKLVGMHHERFDGKGYPRGLRGDEIPIGAYILAVSDTLDTMLSHRAYKRGKTVEEAMTEFLRCKGTQFHPDVIDALLDLHAKLGDDVFKNSAVLVDQAVIVGKVKTRPKS